MVDNTTPLRRPEILVNDLGDQTILYSAEGQAIHVLNPTARLIWDLCDGTHTPEVIEEAIRASFAVPEERDVAADVRQTLSTFAEKGLLQT